MDHHQKVPRGRQADRQKPTFSLGVGTIRNRHRQRISEDRAGFGKGSSVLLTVDELLCKVPFEAHSCIIALYAKAAAAGPLAGEGWIGFEREPKEGVVGSQGLEPWTYGLKVRCSTS